MYASLGGLHPRIDSLCQRHKTKYVSVDWFLCCAVLCFLIFYIFWNFVYRKCPNTPSSSRPLTWRATWTSACPTQPRPSSASPTSTTIPQNWQSERWVLKSPIHNLWVCVKEPDRYWIFGANSNNSKKKKKKCYCRSTKQVRFFFSFFFCKIYCTENQKWTSRTSVSRTGITVALSQSFKCIKTLLVSVKSAV